MTEVGVAVEHLPHGATVRVLPGSAGGPVLVVWPALGVPADKYRRLARSLNDQGAHVALADYRGQQDSSVPIGHRAGWGYREVACEDMGEVIDLVRERFPDSPVALVCHSLGGQLAAVLEHDGAGRFDALALVASGTPHWAAFEGASRLRPLVLPTVAAVLARVRGRFDGRRLGFGVQGSGLIADWARMARTGSWDRAGHELPRREFPLLAVSFAGDDLAPPAAVRALAEQFPAAARTYRHLEHPTGHAGWLKEPDAAAGVLLSWLGLPGNDS